MKAITVLVAILVLVLAAFAILWPKTPESTSKQIDRENSPDDGFHARQNVTVVEEQVVVSLTTRAPIEEEIKSAQLGCIEKPYEEAEFVAPDEFALYQSTWGSGPFVRVFRGLGKADVEGHALQGDTAAMVSMGYFELLAAHGFDQSSFLSPGSGLSYDERMQLDVPPTDMSPENVAHLEKASEWYYQAALGGRIQALAQHGYILAMSGASAVSLGWVNQEEYTAMSRVEQDALHPGIVYRQLIKDLAPGLANGPLRQRGYDYPGKEPSKDIRAQLQQQFFDDLEMAYLDPPPILNAQFPEYVALMENECR